MGESLSGGYFIQSTRVLEGASPFESDAGACPGGSEEHMDFKLTIFSDYI